MKRYALLLCSLFCTLVLFAQDPQGLKVGDQAPLFTATDQQGREFSLAKALEKGDVVLLFYRGQWCPYCKKQLSQMTDSLSFITAKGATVVAVSPEIQENVLKTVSNTKASFPVLSDLQMRIMKAYKVNFPVPAETVTRYKGFGIDFNQANGENGANLPVPATYIIGKDGKIRFVFFDPDYRKRVSVKDLASRL